MAEKSHPEHVEGLTQANKADGRPIYEVGFHLVPTIDEAAVAAFVQSLRAEISKGGAGFISEGAPEKMTLAYTVERASTGKREKYNDAYFGWVKFATERENIPGLESFLRETKEVLRYLLIETVREDVTVAPRRAVFTSDRLEGETIKKPVAAPEEKAPVSEEELDKSIDALVS